MLVRRVSGNSMLPTLFAGDIVVSLNVKPKAGDIVIVSVGGREVIKRVQNISPTALFLVGDNLADSTDSRSYGDIPITSLLGIVKITFNKKRPKKFIS